MAKTIEQVKAEMGESWLLHPENHVKRRRVPLEDSAGVDVSKTFARVRRARKEHAEAETARRQAAAEHITQFTPRRRTA